MTYVIHLTCGLDLARTATTANDAWAYATQTFGAHVYSVTLLPVSA